MDEGGWEAEGKQRGVVNLRSTGKGGINDIAVILVIIIFIN